MREIKFRAWHREKRVMFPVIAIAPQDGWVEVEPAPDSIWRTDLDDVELMQFTGLKDRNGVEIFEGDITEYGNEIKFGSFYAYISHLGKYYITGFYYENGDGECIPLEDDTEIVIGNVYEHPELIK